MQASLIMKLAKLASFYNSTANILQIEEQILIDFFADCGKVESIDWMTDKESGKFYGTVCHSSSEFAIVVFRSFHSPAQ